MNSVTLARLAVIAVVVVASLTLARPAGGASTAR
jgi:hypothetical protein